MGGARRPRNTRAGRFSEAAGFVLVEEREPDCTYTRAAAQENSAL
ncbi:hypothetical protein [Geodermatophilus sp. URMC 63]